VLIALLFQQSYTVYLASLIKKVGEAIQVVFLKPFAGILEYDCEILIPYNL
jgi:hypothetical protein